MKQLTISVKFEKQLKFYKVYRWLFINNWTKNTDVKMNLKVKLLKENCSVSFRKKEIFV